MSEHCISCREKFPCAICAEYTYKFKYGIGNYDEDYSKLFLNDYTIFSLDNIIILEKDKAINLSILYPDKKLYVYYKNLIGYKKSESYFQNGKLYE